MSPTKRIFPSDTIATEWQEYLDKSTYSRTLIDLDFTTTEQRVFATMMARQMAHDDFYNQLIKEEDNMNNNTLDLASLIADNTPEGMEVCKDKSTDGKIVFKKKIKSTRWKEIGHIKGWATYLDSDLCANQGDTKGSYPGNRHNLYATEAQCKAHLAQAQLSQIMKEVNGDWEADWRDANQNKYCITLAYAGYESTIAWSCPKFLSFKSKELAEQVLRENTDLLEQYKPLAG